MNMEIQKKLFALQDISYQAFQRKLIPTINPDAIIGVRMPELRKLARQIGQTPAEAERFLMELPHQYYEENNLHGLLICACKEYGKTVEALDTFLPYVDNWATCDLLHPITFRQRPEGLLEQVRTWMASSYPYTIRFGISVLMNDYMKEGFQTGQMDWVAALQSEEYYVNMMIAWYFATALSFHYKEALPYLQENRLSTQTHNMTIQKAVDSYRVTSEQKIALRALRRTVSRSKK